MDNPVPLLCLTRPLQVPEHDPRAPSRVCDACYASINRTQMDASTGGQAAASHSNAKSPSAAASAREPEQGRSELSIADFEVIRHLGKGAFGQVLEVCKIEDVLAKKHDEIVTMRLQVVEKRTKKHYALKVTWVQTTLSATSACLPRIHL